MQEKHCIAQEGAPGKVKPLLQSYLVVAITMHGKYSALIMAFDAGINI
jgi:hypothetical protein